MKLLHFIMVHLAHSYLYARLPLGIGLYSNRLCTLDTETGDSFIHDVNHTFKVDTFVKYNSMEDGSRIKAITDSIYHHIIDNLHMGIGWLRTAPLDFNFSYSNLSIYYYNSRFIPYINIHTFSNNERNIRLVTIIDQGYIRNSFISMHT